MYSFARTHPILSGAAEPPTEAAAPSADEGLPAVLRDVASTIPNLATALIAGSTAGVATYVWRSPWDTLYKKSLGWRPLDAPLLSPARFLTSPRGLKAVGISGVTWMAYEAAVLAVRQLTAFGILSEPSSSGDQKQR